MHSKPALLLFTYAKKADFLMTWFMLNIDLKKILSDNDGVRLLQGAKLSPH